MPNNTPAQPGAPKVPRDSASDYSEAMARRRREFAAQQTGQALPHVGHYSIDPASLPGNIENFIGVSQVPIGLAGPLLIRGEHASGHFYVPLATTEGTLVASYNRGMRLITECGSVKTTVVEQYMQRSPVFVFDDALKAREFGSWVEVQFDAIKAAAAVPTMTDHIRSGKVKAFGTTGDKRSAVLPEVPTVSEAGVPGYEAVIWLGVMAPRNTPRDIVNRLNAEISTITSRPDVRDAWAKQGAVAMTMTPDEFARFMTNDIAKWDRIVKTSGAKADQ